MSSISIVDYVVFAATLLVSLIVGIYYAFSGGKQKTTKEFLLANRSLGVFPVSMSMFASFVSALALLGIPAEIYFNGSEIFIILIGHWVSCCISIIFFVPIFYKLQLVSVNKYLEMRFGPASRSLGCAMFIIHMLLYMSIVIYAPSLAINQVTGFSMWGSILTTSVVCIIYTTIGGMKAVVWTDTLQTMLMLGSMLVITIKGCIDVGSFNHVWDLNLRGDRLNTFNFDPDPTVRHSFWAFSIGSSLLWVSFYGVNQATVQRYSCLPNLRSAKRAMFINLIPLTILILLTTFGGLVLYAKYYECDPLLTKQISAPDQIFPLFVVESMSNAPGLPGLFFSGILSGSLSTVSSGMNSLAAVTLEDIIKVYYKKELKESTLTLITKFTALFYGVLCVCLVAVADQFGQLAQAGLFVGGLAGGPVLSLFIVGIFFPWVKEKSALLATFMGFLVCFWMGIGKIVMKPTILKPAVSVSGCPQLYINTSNEFNLTNYHLSNRSIDSFLPTSDLSSNDDIPLPYRISYLWITLVAIVVCITCSFLFSLIFGLNKVGDIDPKLLSPIYRNKWKIKETQDSESSCSMEEFKEELVRHNN